MASRLADPLPRAHRTISADVFRDLFEAGPDVVLLVDAAGKIVRANGQVKAVLGYQPSELEGQAVEILVPNAYRGSHAVKRESFMRSPKARPMGVGLALAAVRRDGTEFPVEIMLAPLGPDLVAAVVRDITGRRAMENAEAEIRRLQDIAVYRSRFLNVAAHELKTPLTPIRIQLQLLRNYLVEPTPKVSKAMSVLSRSVDRLQNLVQDILDAARIQADRLRLRKEPLSLSEVVVEAAETYAAVAGSIGMRFKVEAEPGVNVIGDPDRLLQVVTNLLSNAMKFTPGGGSVELELKQQEGYAAIEVRDSGLGMEPDQTKRLFEPFAQVHDDVVITQKGTGLGLYISKAIVHQHGGTIELTSPGAGKGTTAIVRIPTSQEPVAPPASKEVPRKEGIRGMV